MMFNALGIGGHEQMKAYELIESETRAIIEDIRRQMDRPRSQPATEDLQRYLDESVMRRDG